VKEEITEFFEKNFQTFLDIYEKLVMTNSFTANPDGVNQNSRILIDVFSPLGFIHERFPSSNPEFGNHLVLTKKGKSDRRIGLITHLDTVFSSEEENRNNFSWRIEGDRVYGPGTNDIKGGTIIILMMMKALKKFSPVMFDEINWFILANAAEERWSEDFGEICLRKLGKDTIAALVFEAGYFEDDTFTLVRARKGMAIYDITVEGKSAHAGSSHQYGANAIAQIANVIQRVESLTDYENNLTFNIGVITGGSVPNRVPHSASARGEMRAFNKKVFDYGIQKLVALNDLETIESAADGYKCQVDLKLLQEIIPWQRNEKTDHLISIWDETARLLDFNVLMEERGGLSDGNQLWEHIPTLDGLGPNGRNSHCSEQSKDGKKQQEFATLSSFIPKAILNTLAVHNLVSND
jgi:glutamate carboxypeptidase